MYFVYILRSLKNSKRYVGYTGKDPVERLKEHNKGANAWTKHNGPFELVHSEQFEDKTEARKRELFLKCGQGKKFLDELLK